MKGKNMEKMQEKDFEKIVFESTPDHCKVHKVVKLYDNGAHSDYGCIKCGMCSFNLKDFENK
jgi:hypothetical protein